MSRLVKHYDVIPQQPVNGLTVVELFCGGGLMAMGLKRSGYTIKWANDFDFNACKAYASNIGNVVHGDITKIDLDSIPDSDIIAGGPPCQDFSIANQNGAGDNGDRGRLVWAYLGVIRHKKPKAFIFENVKNLVGKKNIHTFKSLIGWFESIGYEVSYQVINSWDYGVAQKRERVIVVGIRKDLGFRFEFPEPKPEDYQTQVLRDVIGDLPDPRSTTMVNHLPNPQDGGYSSQYLSRDRVVGWDEPAHTVLTSPRDASIHPGDGSITMDQVRNHHGKAYWYPKAEYNFDQANRPQRMDQPSSVIPGHHNSGQPQHPTQAPRRFTIREALRIQSVPDSYVLPEEHLALSAQYRVVGNGVASKVAWYLGISLAEQLRRYIG